MTLFNVYVFTTFLCLCFVAYFRHKLATTHGELAGVVIIACIPAVNIVLVCVVLYLAHYHEAVMAWLDRPFK